MVDTIPAQNRYSPPGAAEDIVIHTVTFSAEADFTRMQDVANETGGQHFHAPNAAALEQIFREIASTLPVLLTE